MHFAEQLHHSLPPSQRTYARSAVESIPSPYRVRIWTQTNTYHFGECECKRKDLGQLAEVLEIFAAKLSITIPSPASCRRLVQTIDGLPNDPFAVPRPVLLSKLEQFLTATRLPANPAFSTTPGAKQARADEGMAGIGFRTAMCLLADLKEGRYAPNDQKLVCGLRKTGVLTRAEAKQLSGCNIHDLVDVYVTKVLPAWRAGLAHLPPQDLDKFWGLHGDEAAASCTARTLKTIRPALPTVPDRFTKTLLDFYPSPYRRSIWKHSDAYHPGQCGCAQKDLDLDRLARVYEVVAAKRRIAFPTPAVCMKLANLVKAMPDDPTTVPIHELETRLKAFLNAIKASDMAGVGFATAICVLAVMKRGWYAPMDRKVASGLAFSGVLTAKQAKHLLGTNVHDFVRAYATAVLPAWRSGTEHVSPQDLDDHWGRLSLEIY